MWQCHIGLTKNGKELPVNRFFCKLTGGHRYKDADLQVTCDGDIWTMENHCTKCGEKWVGKIHGQAWLDYGMETKGAFVPKHGRWFGFSYHTCSVCGKEAADDGWWKSPFCPHCGAMMDEERKDNES